VLRAYKIRDEAGFAFVFHHGDWEMIPSCCGESRDFMGYGVAFCRSGREIANFRATVSIFLIFYTHHEGCFWVLTIVFGGMSTAKSGIIRKIVPFLATFLKNAPNFASDELTFCPNLRQLPRP